MDPEKAKQLFVEGANLVLLDVPLRTEFGIDYNSWNVGPNFKGIKMIPPGVHFVYYSSVSTDGQTGPRTGFFHFFKPQEVFIKRWDPKVEDFSDDTVTEDLRESIRQNLVALDSNLGPYPYDSLKRWVSLSNYVDEQVLSRVQPVFGKISSVAKLASSPSNLRETDQKNEKEQTMETEPAAVVSDSKSLPDEHFAGVGKFPKTKSDVRVKPGEGNDFALKLDKDHMLRFAEILDKKYPSGASPAEMSKYSMDHSYVLTTMMKTAYNSKFSELLAELQIAFTSFLIGQVFSAFDWWKSMVTLLCFSEEALSDHTQLYTAFISTIHFQLQEVPSDFFVDIVTKDNFLTITLQRLFSNLEQSQSADRSLVKKALQFRDNLSRKYSWDFSAECLDYQPTVVEDV